VPDPLPEYRKRGHNLPRDQLNSALNSILFAA
jgi:hypothetical protein